MKISICIFLVLLTMFSCQFSKEKADTSGDFLSVSSFKDEGIEREPIDNFLKEVDDGYYGNVDRILLIKNGKLVLDKSYSNDYKKISHGISSQMGCGYNTCEDSTIFGEYNYYHPFWHPYYKNSSVHTLQSVTKSIGSLMIGIAIDQGSIPSANDALINYLTDYDTTKVEKLLKEATIENLLSMKIGIKWKEIGSFYTDSTRNTRVLERSNDWVKYVLDQPMDTLPGTKWIYNSGASQIMSVIIKKGTGLHLDDFAEKYLFKPLEIKNYHWKRTPNGFPDAEGGLYLEAEDLAKIGQLILNKGIWNGKQIVSSQWIEKSTSRLSDTTQVRDYGYGFQWWRPDHDGIDIIGGFGYGGQSLIIIPEFKMIAVTNCWNVFGKEVPDIRHSILTPLIAANKKNADNKQ